MRTLGFELAFFQEEIFTLELDHGTSVESGSEDDNVCPMIETPSVPSVRKALGKHECRSAVFERFLSTAESQPKHGTLATSHSQARAKRSGGSRIRPIPRRRLCRSQI